MADKRRVVVTGLGLVTPAGSSVDGLWEGVTCAPSSVGRISRFDATEFRSQIAAEVNDFQFEEYSDRGKPSRLDRFSQFAVSAAVMAVRDGSVDQGYLREHGSAVYLGSALGGIAFGEDQHRRYLASGIRSVAPALALTVFSGAGATNIAIHLGLNGPSISNANSCASGAIAIGEAFRLIQVGDVDIALAGGAECPLAPLTFGSFSLIKAMSKLNDSPASACRPFDTERDGFVMGEGAAVLILEERQKALARGARIRGEILGYATTNDAHHMTVPLPDGREAARAMHLALADSGTNKDDIAYINAHATGTPLGDAAEAAAIRTVFGEKTPPVSSTKPVHGHSLGASGAIEAAITLLALERRFIPGTLNLSDVDPACSLDHVCRPGVGLGGTVGMSNSFGFGGTNAVLVMGTHKG